MIEQLANKTAKAISKDMDLAFTTKIFRQLKKNNAISNNVDGRLLTKDEAIKTFTYSLTAIYGEIIKLIILLTIATILHILLPVVIITITFSIYRAFAGGVHLSKFETCLVATTTMIIVSALLVSNIVITNELNVVISMIIITVSSVVCEEYAPYNKKNKNKLLYKRLSTNFLILILVIEFILVLLNVNQLIILSITIAIALETFSIAPIGIKFFNKLDEVTK